MVQSKASTVEEYLAELPDERRAEFETALAMVRRNVPEGYREMISFGAVSWGIPLEEFPDTYNGQPLCYAALAAQKNYFALYLMNVYGDAEQEQALRDGYARAGKKLDMGKSCLRFKSVDDLAIPAVAAALAATPPKKYIEIYEKSRAPKTGAKKRAPKA